MSIENLLASRPVAIAAQCAQERAASLMLVGGAVRDALLGRAPGDLDFAVHGDAVRVARRCANLLDGSFYIMDAERGVARVLIPSAEPGSSPQVLDFVRRRGESWEADLLDRDFTINAIACDVTSSGDAAVIFDPLGGAADLRARVLRRVAVHSLRDDPVRGVRGVRMAHQFGLSIEPQTWTSICESAAALDRPSAERVRDAFLDLLALEAAAAALGDLWRAGLLGRILPELPLMAEVTQSPPHMLDVLEHTFAVVRAESAARAALEERLAPEHRAALHAHFNAPAAEGRSRRVLLRLALLLHDCGKPRTRTVDPDGRIRFFEHEAVGAQMAAARAAALRLSAQSADFLKRLVALHMRPNQFAREAQSFTPRALHRLAARAVDCLPALALLAVCDCMGKGSAAGCEPSVDVAAALTTAYFTRYDTAVQPAPLLTGADLLALGMRPGPHVGRVLDAVREAQMAGEISDAATALALARHLLAQNS